MNSILAVEKGLPPGLWLPRANEPTEQYLSSGFDRNDHTYDEIVDYGTFVVALAMFDTSEKTRISYIPTTEDFRDMHTEGYGISLYKLNRYYGGVAALQRALGFYPAHFRPSKEELLERLDWMSQYPLDIDHDLRNPGTSVHKIISWGSDRDLIPSEEIIYDVMEGDTTDIQRIFAIEKPHARKQLSFLGLYRFGDKIIRENGGPITIRELGRKYDYLFVGTAYSAIKAFFGTYNNFWLEFGFVPDSKGLNKTAVANLGIRNAIENGEVFLTPTKISKLSKEKRFCSMHPIKRHFGGLAEYTAAVKQGYQAYLTLQDNFSNNGVDKDVFELACHKFEPTTKFAEWLTGNIGTLAKLSVDSNCAKYAKRLVKDGFNISDEEIFSMQTTDLKNALRKLDIIDDEDVRFVLSLMPRVEPTEIIPRQ